MPQNTINPKSEFETSNRLTIAVVICAYNEQDWITKTVESLTQQRRLADEVIVVDNASTDGTSRVVQEFIDSHPGYNIKLVHEPHKGLWRARDTGWRATTSEVVASTDADITFPADWLEIIEKHFASPETKAVTGIWRYTDALPFINWVSAWVEKGRIKSGQWQLFGANSAIRRRILEEVDGYTDKPIDAFEDQYITTKLEAAGYKIQYLLDLRVWHTFRRFNKEGLTGYLKYLAADWDGEAIYPDHLSDESRYTVSIVVPTLNSAKVITSCLAFLVAQQPFPNEIIVVDINSTDSTRECVSTFSASHPNAKITWLQADGKDIKQAREMGLTAASGDLVVQVGADQIFPENWLAKIHAAFVCTRQLGAIGGEIRLTASPSLRFVGQLGYNLRVRWRNGKSVYLHDDMIAYRRDLVQKLRAEGGSSYADADLVSRIQTLGYRVRFNPDFYTFRQPS